MKKFVIQAIFLIIIIAAALIFFSPVAPTNIEIPFLPQQPNFQQLEIRGTKLKVEIADTQSKRSKGLSGREALASDEGMLFIFDRADKYPFWMKGLNFPLDFIWIREDKVVDLLPQASPPAPGQSDESLPIYSSRIEVDKVLEVSAGIIQRLGIQIGDTIVLRPL